MTNIVRLARHLLTTRRAVRRAFGYHGLAAIERAIAASEARQSGQIRFAVEAALDGWPLFQGQSPRERAIEVFARLRVWDTEHNNGLLIYLLLADRAVEIVADRGIHARVGTAQWHEVCQRMEAAFRQGRFESGVVEGIAAVTGLLEQHFPAAGRGPNELPDRPVVL